MHFPPIALSVCLLPALHAVAPPCFAATELPIVRGGPTVLMADRAERSDTLKEKLVWGNKPWGRAWVENWTTPKEYLRWIVNSPAKGRFDVAALIAGRAGTVVEIAGQAGQIQFTLGTGEWQRIEVPGTLSLPAGRSTITLRLRETDDTVETTAVKIKSLELVNLADRADLERRIRSLKAPTGWLRDAGYGLMFQCGEWSYPRHGPKKTWPKMIDDFDVERFARMVEETGAGYVIWSATWSTYYFPAPIQAIDRIVPGHTSRRDLIGELAGALGRRGIRLMIYYHEGWEQKDWWEKNWDPSDPEKKQKFVTNLCSILDEAGKRYGPKVAGWFFDDGMAYYPAPFEQITRAAKAGNRNRLVSYNSWVLPKMTDFQDLYFGEGFKGNDATAADGLFPDGPYKGLFAHGMFILDGPDWGINKPDVIIRAPVPAETLISSVTRAMKHGQALSLNLLMYEDGSVSAESIEALKALGSAVRGKHGQSRLRPGVPSRQTGIAQENHR